MKKHITAYCFLMFIFFCGIHYATISSQQIPAMPELPAGLEEIPTIPDIPQAPQPVAQPASPAIDLPALPEPPTVVPAQAPVKAPAPTTLPSLPEVPTLPAPPPAKVATPAPQSIPAPLPALPEPAAVKAPAEQAALPQQDLNQIASNIATIKTLKTTILDQLKDIDEKIYEARMLDAQAKKLSFSILNAPNQTEANKILNQVSEATRKIKTLEEKIKVDSSKNIDANITKIQDLMKNLEVSITKLEAQGVSFQAKELETLDKAKAPVAKPVEKTVVLTIEKQAPAPAPTLESKSFLQHVADIFVNMIVGVIRAFGNVFSFFKNLIVPATQQPAPQPSEQPQTQKSIPGQPVADDVKKKALESVTEKKIEQEAQQQVAQGEQRIKNLDQTQKKLADKFEAIEKPVERIVDLAARNPALQNILETKEEEAPLIEPNSTFKKTAVAGFSTITDWFIVAVNTVGVEIKKAYSYLAQQVKQRLAAPEAKITDAKEQESAGKELTEKQPTAPPLMPLTQPTTR